jgi:hypothetical protein
VDGGDILQRIETASQNQILHRDKRECNVDTDLDSIDNYIK